MRAKTYPHNIRSIWERERSCTDKRRHLSLCFCFIQHSMRKYNFFFVHTSSHQAEWKKHRRSNWKHYGIRSMDVWYKCIDEAIERKLRIKREWRKSGENMKLSLWQRYSALPSTQSCVRTSNNLDMMHNSYELSTGWRQAIFSDTSISWFISEIQMSFCCIRMRYLHSNWQLAIGNFTLVLLLMWCHEYHVFLPNNRQLHCVQTERERVRVRNENGHH